MHRVKVRRERPAAAAWALAVLLTALFVFLIARGAGTQSGEETPESAPRRAYALTFAPLETHLVQFGAYEDALSARIEAARYMPRGAAGYVLEGSLYRVIGAGYDSRQDAQGVCERLREEEGMEASVYSLSSGEVELTIQGTQAQVEALTQAETALRNAAAQLNETAFGYDRGELSSEDARNRLAIIAASVRQAHQALSQAAAHTENSSIDAFLSILSDLAAETEQLSNENVAGGLSFSGRIKYNYISVRVRHIGVLKAMGDLRA